CHKETCASEGNGGPQDTSPSDVCRGRSARQDWSSLPLPGHVHDVVGNLPRAVAVLALALPDVIRRDLPAAIAFRQDSRLRLHEVRRQSRRRLWNDDDAIRPVRRATHPAAGGIAARTALDRYVVHCWLLRSSEPLPPRPAQRTVRSYSLRSLCSRRSRRLLRDGRLVLRQRPRRLLSWMQASTQPCSLESSWLNRLPVNIPAAPTPKPSLSVLAFAPIIHAAALDMLEQLYRAAFGIVFVGVDHDLVAVVIEAAARAAVIVLDQPAQEALEARKVPTPEPVLDLRIERIPRLPPARASFAQVPVTEPAPKPPRRHSDEEGEETPEPPIPRTFRRPHGRPGRTLIIVVEGLVLDMPAMGLIVAIQLGAGRKRDLRLPAHLRSPL